MCYDGRAFCDDDFVAEIFGVALQRTNGTAAAFEAKQPEFVDLRFATDRMAQALGEQEDAPIIGDVAQDRLPDGIAEGNRGEVGIGG